MTDAKSEKNVEEQMKDEGKKDQWWAAFPEPKASVPEITGDDLYEMFDEMDIKPEPRSFLLVDVRRTDWEVCDPGRGPRCANWMQDYINDVSKFGRRSALKVKILKGGIKGWVKEYEGSMMDGFQEDYWKQFKDQAKVESK
ncbi:hypothetical protein M7I_6175 [Glarea lozoyensis 74030]|uniref:Rhodanese domain-containing protein n=1 Tax=Glarea lozoyensis (strain ATCC 74030 / MF5533) TaxID=1104152 RepID=H0ETV4_GLAL7|nr:hypothetical protein M7I_6175 [Glarea lozoyensis 74030]